MTRISAIASAVIVLLVMPTVSRAQRAQAVGVTRRAVPTSMPQALRVTSTDVVGSDTTQVTASDTPRWVGAAIGAVVGGVAGYKWYGGLCKGENGCSGRPGAVSGTVVVGVFGYLLGDAFEP